MEKSSKILSDIIVFMKYARYREDLGRRETWTELVTRNKEMHQRKYPDLHEAIEEAYELVYQKKVLPSMRSLQFAGKPIEINPARIYNCSYLPIDHQAAFSEIMFLLLGGTGVGFSVQQHHIEKLPDIRKPRQEGPYSHRRYLISDSIEGWADSVKVLIKSYFEGTSNLVFDFSDIRSKGARLVTAGGKAPGPEPLKICLRQIKSILNEKENGTKLTSLEVHDIICHIADAVLAGGIRRAALISLFSADDMDMLTAKSGNWTETNPQRGRCNNSAVLIRHRIRKKFFTDLWKRIELSNCGEPGIYFSNDKDWGANPCVEIGLRPNQFCNLCEVNASNISSQEDFNERVKTAAFIGTLQAGYTDFHYLRNIWKRTTEKDALIGIGLTGIGSRRILDFDLTEASELAVETNRIVADLIGINAAARTTCIKPAGTSSLVLGCASGIHEYHAEYYLRRLRAHKNEALYIYLAKNHPELIEDCFEKPHLQAIITVPQKAPEGAILRDSALDLLWRVKKFNDEWIQPGHITGNNSHNISATVSIKPGEWDAVGEWMWQNRESYNGLSVLPFDGGTYPQMPFEACTKETYEKLMATLSDVDLAEITEFDDATNLSGELACTAGNCTVVYA